MKQIANLLALIPLIMAAGCDRAPATPKTPPPREPLNVITTAYPLGDVTRRVGDRAVRVEWIVEGGQSLESIEVTDDMRNRLRTADLLISGGGSNEAWACEGFGDALGAQRIIRLDLLETAGSSRQAATHLWLDPLVMREFTGALADRLGTLRTGEQGIFRKNADVQIAQIDAALAEHRAQLDRLSGKKVITLSPDFSALTGRFGLVEIRPVDEQSPMRLSDVDIARIRQAARDHGARTMLLSTDVPRAVVQDLANRTGLSVLTLDVLGTSATTGNGGGHTSYTSLLQYNLGQLVSVQ